MFNFPIELCVSIIGKITMDPNKNPLNEMEFWKALSENSHDEHLNKH